MYTGVFRVDGKIWASIGGVTIGTPKAGTKIKGDKLFVGDVTYMHLLEPQVGYTKTSFLNYTQDTTPPPPPSTVAHITLTEPDGRVRFFDETV